MPCNTSDSTPAHALPDEGAPTRPEFMGYEFTKQEPGEPLAATVGPFETVGEARAAIARDLARGRPWARRQAARFAASVPLSGRGVQAGGRGPAYAIRPRPRVREEDAERLRREAVERARREDAHARREGGVVLVHLEALLSGMAEHVPAHLQGRERAAYAEAVADIPIHLPNAMLEHSPETGALDWSPASPGVDTARVIGSRQDGTGIWRGTGEPTPLD